MHKTQALSIKHLVRGCLEGVFAQGQVYVLTVDGLDVATPWEVIAPHYASSVGRYPSAGFRVSRTLATLLSSGFLRMTF